MPEQILAPTVAAARTRPFLVKTDRQITSMQVGLGGAETAALEISPDEGTTWVAVLPPLPLSVANPSRQITAPGLYSYVKGVTLSTAIYVATEDNA